MLASFRADRPGFVRADLVRITEDTWLDIVVRESSEAYAASRDKGGNTPAIRAFFAPIAELISAAEGVIAG